MVQSWFHDVMTKPTEFVNDLLMHFYRWLNSSESLLFEPALLRMVRVTMRKVFVHLMAELRKLGSTIVFASCNKIIVATEKTNCSDAHVYMDYILGVMNKNALFRYSVPTPSKVLHALLRVHVVRGTPLSYTIYGTMCTLRQRYSPTEVIRIRCRNNSVPNS